MSAKMKKAMRDAGVVAAKHLSVGTCTNEDCDCNGVFVQLLDKEGNIFAVGSLLPQDALAYAEQLRMAAHEVLAAQSGFRPSLVQ